MLAENNPDIVLLLKWLSLSRQGIKINIQHVNLIVFI